MSPYSDLYGGAVLNATINRYVWVTLKPLVEKKVILEAIDHKHRVEFPLVEAVPVEEPLLLHRGAYNRIVKEFVGEPVAVHIATYAEAPPGSGLGTSSTLVVALIGAFAELLRIALGEYDVAHLAYEIERVDLGLAGGKQDQYAATFGGVNFMEFFGGDRVIVNPLRVRREYLSELEHNLLLYYTGTSRLSSRIIEAQVKSVQMGEGRSLEAMHKLKEQAFLMKEALLKGRIDEIGEILHFGWTYKKQMAEGITNPVIEEIYEAALRAGALGGKVSGAGGGGHMIFYCPENTKHKVVEALMCFEGRVEPFKFEMHGYDTWRM